MKELRGEKRKTGKERREKGFLASLSLSLGPKRGKKEGKGIFLSIWEFVARQKHTHIPHNLSPVQEERDGLLFVFSDISEEEKEMNDEKESGRIG